MMLVWRFVTEEQAADAVEYALVIAFIALAIVAGANALGGAIGDKLNVAAGRLPGCNTGSTSC